MLPAHMMALALRTSFLPTFPMQLGWPMGSHNFAVMTAPPVALTRTAAPAPLLPVEPIKVSKADVNRLSDLLSAATQILQPELKEQDATKPQTGPVGSQADDAFGSHGSPSDCSSRAQPVATLARSSQVQARTSSGRPVARPQSRLYEYSIDDPQREEESSNEDEELDDDDDESDFDAPRRSKQERRIAEMELKRRSQNQRKARQLPISPAPGPLTTTSQSKTPTPSKDGNGRFYCTHPGCGSYFNTRFSLKRHGKKHSGIRPFACGECGRSFAEKSTLARHKRTHTGERPFSCASCDKRFSHRANIRRHMVGVHFIHESAALLCTENNCNRMFAGEKAFRAHHIAEHGQQAPRNFRQVQQDELNEDMKMESRNSEGTTRQSNAASRSSDQGSDSVERRSP